MTHLDDGYVPFGFGRDHAESPIEEEAVGALIRERDELRAALGTLAKAVGDRREAWAGRGHDGPHDRDLHSLLCDLDSELCTERDHCLACAAAQYGTDANLYEYVLPDALALAGGCPMTRSEARAATAVSTSDPAADGPPRSSDGAGTGLPHRGAL